MLFRKHIVSTRTLIQLTVAVAFCVATVGAAVAANSGNPPLLVPYTVTTVAGNPQFTATGTVINGYGGDGGPAVPTLSNYASLSPQPTMTGPHSVVTDSVGNIYFTDTSNAVIREVNFQTGIINTIAGLVPHGCSGVSCSVSSGCADGVPAYGAKIGGAVYGIAVDSFGNVYFDDNSSSTVSMVYRGGKRVAQFISLVDPGAAATPSAVQVGYLYHIGGTINLTSCATTTTPLVDNALAFENSASPGATPGPTLNAPQVLSLDSAGNIYISDTNNHITRIINTQTTPQTFFQYTIQPGYMRVVSDCNAAVTVPCPAITTNEVGAGINGPSNAVVFNSQYVAGESDAYGNVFLLNGTGSGTAAPTIYVALEYAGGTPMTNLLTAEAPFLSNVYSPAGASIYPVPAGDTLTPNELPLTYGNSYISIDNMSDANALGNNIANLIAVTNSEPSVRASSANTDQFGTMWFFDNHYPELMRNDQFTADLTGIFGSQHMRGVASVAGLGSVLNANGTTSNYNTPASFVNPWNCVYGATGAGNQWLYGPQSYDPMGDGCPAILGYMLQNSGRYNTWVDSVGNLYYPDGGDNVIREFTVGTQFPTTAVGTTKPVTQPIQVHFDASNIPVTGGLGSSVSVPDGPNLGFTTSAFAIAAGSGDFTIDTTDLEFPEGSVTNNAFNSYGQTPQTQNFAMWAGLPTCTQLGLSSPDNSWDCLVYVTFNPTQPGLRTGTLVATTANGSVYNFQLTGVGTGGQLAIDGGQQATVAATGLGTTSSVAVTSGGTVYIADPTNNRIVVKPVSGGQTAIGPSVAVSSPVFGQTSTGIAQTLSNPYGVAVDAAGNVYIADTGNNRVLEYNPVTATAVVLGNYLWVPGAACDGGTTTAAVNCVFTAYTSNSASSAQKQSISGGTVGGTATTAEPGAVTTPTTAPPQYTFKAPESVAVDAWGNVYVADTGNAVIVEIPSNTSLGGATPLFQYTGAPTFTTPVAVAVDSKGFIYVADQQNVAGEVVRIPPGGGDLQPASTSGTSALSVVTTLPLYGGQGISTPNGVAVDAAGNVYVSDGTGNAVWEAPALGPPSGTPFTLSFTGLNSPAGLALDANGNLYVADSGNKQVLVMNRANPTVSFGTVPQDLGLSGTTGTPTPAQPVCSNTVISNGLNVGNNGGCVLTVSNIGNQPVTLVSPFLGTITNPAYSVTTAGHLTTCATTIPVGATCTISPLFTPTSDGLDNATVTVNGTQSVAMVSGTGTNPEVNIVLTPSNGTGTSPNYTSSAAAETITATVSQPHVLAAPTPTGTVTFTYVIDAINTGTANAGLCGTGGSTGTAPAGPTTGTSGPVTLVGGVATYVMPALAQGESYTISGVYTPAVADTTDSITSATPIVLTVPGITEQVNATSVSYTYGTAVPAITGTVAPAPASPTTFTFSSGASQFSAIGVYPVQVVFSGGNFCAYGNPVAYISGTSGPQATVTEKAAALSVVVPAYTTVYGAPSLNYASGMVITGAVGTDLKKLSATFTPADSSVLDVVPGSPYTVIPTVTGKPVGNYTVTITDGTDTVTAAPAGIAVTVAKTSVANTTAGLASATYAISVGTLVTAGKGVPTGTVSVTDNFVPITSTSFIPTPASGVFPTVNGAIQWPSSLIVIPPCATGQTSTATVPCNAVLTLTAGAGTFTLPATEATTTGTHYLSFAYSGDAGTNGDAKGDFACSVYGETAVGSCPSTGATPPALIVDFPDFNLTSTLSPIAVLPGNIPNGNGLPTVPGQTTSNPQSAIIQVNGILSFAGTVNLSCVTQNPSYESCFVGQITVVSNVVQLVPYVVLTTSSELVPFIFDVQTPATLPLGFNTTGQLRTAATRTVLAFLPLGFLAFCVRRRRRLSKALWMLIAIAAVGAGMSGCGGNQVDFYTPVPTGPQTVTVNATYQTIGASIPTETRTFVVPVNID